MNNLFDIEKYNNKIQSEWYSEHFVLYYMDKLEKLDYSCKKDRNKARGLLTDYKWMNKVDDNYVEAKFIKEFVEELDNYEEMMVC